MNQSIQHLIDELGRPPPEVALDWAAQLLDRLTDEGDADQACVAGESDWSAIKVDSEGRLVGDSIAVSNGFAAVRDLIAWSASDDEGLSESPGNASALRRIVLQRAGELRQTSAKTDVPSQSTRPASTTAQSNSATDRPTVSIKARERPAKRTLPWKTIAVGGSAVAGVVIGGLLLWPSGEKTDLASVRRAQSTNAKGDSGDDGGRGRSEHGDQDASGGEVALQTTSSIDSSALPSTSGSAEVTALEDLGGFDTDLAAPEDELGAPGSMAASDGIANEREDRLETFEADPPNGETPETTEPDELAEIDITSQLQQLADSASKDDLDGKSTLELGVTAEADAPNQPALAVPVFPSQQTMELSLDKSVRLRKPALKVELRVADAVKLAPAQAQLVSISQTAFWSVTSEEADGVAVRIAAKLTGGRRPRIQWQIAGLTNQTPAFTLPLSMQYLDRGQDLLARLRSQLNLVIEGLRQAQVPREMRGVITARRQAAQQQLELCENYLKVFVAARRIVGLMDGQIDVHGSLFDEAAPEKPAVSIFGQPSTINDTSDAADQQ